MNFRAALVNSDVPEVLPEVTIDQDGDSSHKRRAPNDSKGCGAYAVRERGTTFEDGSSQRTMKREQELEGANHEEECGNDVFPHGGVLYARRLVDAQVRRAKGKELRAKRRMCAARPTLTFEASLMQTLIVALSLLALSGCYYQHITHDPNRAVKDTNNFLKALYIDQNYQRALDLGDDALHKAATVQDLEKLVQTAEANAGKLEELRAESYLQTVGKTMELFYTGKYHKATLFHRLVLTGDASDGYKVSGVWFKDSPYPEQALRRQLHTKVVVQ